MNPRIVFVLLLQLFINEAFCGDTLNISGNPAPMSVFSAIAGQQPNTVLDTSTTYDIKTTAFSRILTGKINSNMPSGVTLSVQFSAPAGATSEGLVSMTTTAQNLVTSIDSHASDNGLTITYSLSATAEAAPAAVASRTLTLTLQ